MQSLSESYIEDFDAVFSFIASGLYCKGKGIQVSATRLPLLSLSILIIGAHLFDHYNRSILAKYFELMLSCISLYVFLSVQHKRSELRRKGESVTSEIDSIILYIAIVGLYCSSAYIANNAFDFVRSGIFLIMLSCFISRACVRIDIMTQPCEKSDGEGVARALR